MPTPKVIAHPQVHFLATCLPHDNCFILFDMQSLLNCSDLNIINFLSHYNEQSELMLTYFCFKIFAADQSIQPTQHEVPGPSFAQPRHI